MEREAGPDRDSASRPTPSTALKAGDKRRTEALRLLTAALKKERIDAGKDPAEADEIVVLKRERKRRLEALEIYAQGGRAELADRRASRRDHRRVPARGARRRRDRAPRRRGDRASGAESAKDMGKVMGAVMKQVAGRADGTPRERRSCSERLGA